MSEKNHLTLSMNQIRKERDVLARVIQILKPYSQKKREAIIKSTMWLLSADDE